jgi:hypothetical protein
METYEFQETYEDLPDHHFRTEIPNIVFTLGLSPFALTVYLLLKRIAGDKGKCWKTIKNLADSCEIGETKFRQCLKDLAEPFGALGGKSLIKIHRRFKQNKAQESNLIEIIPIWRINGDYYRGLYPAPSVGTPRNTNPPQQDQPEDKGGHRVAMGGASRGEPKEEPSSFGEEEQTNSSFVCSSSQDEKRQCLDRFKLEPSFYPYILKHSKEELDVAIAAVEQYLAKPENAGRCHGKTLVAALRDKWQPNLTLEDIEAVKQAELKKRDDVVAERREVAKKWHSEIATHPTLNNLFSVSDRIVHVKIGAAFGVLDLSCDATMKTLRNIIDNGLKQHVSTMRNT